MNEERLCTNESNYGVKYRLHVCQTTDRLMRFEKMRYKLHGYYWFYLKPVAMSGFFVFSYQFLPDVRVKGFYTFVN